MHQTILNEPILPLDFLVAIQDRAFVIDSDIVGSSRLLWMMRMAEIGITTASSTLRFSSTLSEEQRGKITAELAQKLGYKLIISNLFSHSERGVLYLPGDWYSKDVVTANSSRATDLSGSCFVPTHILDIGSTTSRDGFFTVRIYADKDHIAELTQEVEKIFLENGFIYNPVSIKLMTSVADKIETKNAVLDNDRLGHDLFYPQLPVSMDEYIQAYLNSSANVLLLTGSPGMGKSTLIRTIIQRSRLSAVISSDIACVVSGAVFSHMNDLESNLGERAIVALEDIDRLLTAREEGNNAMSRFLNEADGVAKSNLKIIISTNLSSVKHIDEALLRRGRCFDILEFKPYTEDQAGAIIEEFGLTIPEGTALPVILSDIFSMNEMATTYFSQKKREIKPRSIGFSVKH